MSTPQIDQPQPVKFDVPPPAADLKSLMNLPHGAFGQRMRAGCDPLYGLAGMDPEAWAEFEEFAEETGDLLWVTPPGRSQPEYKPLWAYRSNCPLLLEARPVLRRHLDHYGRLQISVAELLSRVMTCGGPDDDVGEGEGVTEEDISPAEYMESHAAPVPPAPTQPTTPPSATATTTAKTESAPPPAAPVAPIRQEKGPMKFVIEKAALAAALRKIVAIVPKRTTLPILESALLRVEGGGLTLIGTDGTQELRTAVPVVSGTAGAMAIPAGALYGIVDALPDGAQVEVSLTEEKRARIACGRGRFHLPASDERDFPVMSDAAGPEVRFTAGALKEAIDRVAFSIPNNDVHAQLNGLFVHARKEGLRLAAVSRAGMARTDVEVVAGVEGFVRAMSDKAQPGVLLPRESVIALRRVLDGVGSDDEVVVTFTNAITSFNLGIDRYATKMLAEVFPEYERLIQGALNPNVGKPQRMEVPREAFAATVRRVRVLSEDKTRSVHLTLTDDSVRVAAAGQAGADAVDTLECDTGLRQEVEIGFASSHLMDSVSVFKDGELACIVTNAAAPTVWFESGWADPEKADHLVIVMPCRVAPPASAQQSQQAA